jgi:hypothetical protein
MGGYAGDVNSLFFIDIELDDGPLLRRRPPAFMAGAGGPRLGGVATWKRVQVLGQPLTRWVWDGLAWCSC